MENEVKDRYRATLERVLDSTAHEAGDIEIRLEKLEANPALALSDSELKEARTLTLALQESTRGLSVSDLIARSKSAIEAKDKVATITYLQLLEAQTERETTPVKVPSRDRLTGYVERYPRASATRQAIQQVQQALAGCRRETTSLQRLD